MLKESKIEDILTSPNMLPPPPPPLPQEENDTCQRVLRSSSARLAASSTHATRSACGNRAAASANSSGARRARGRSALMARGVRAGSRGALPRARAAALRRPLSIRRARPSAPDGPSHRPEPPALHTQCCLLQRASRHVSRRAGVPRHHQPANQVLFTFI